MEKIKKIKRIKAENIEVYNLEVQENNNYFAEDVLVHNCYVSAGKEGQDFKDICGTWKRWMDSLPPDEPIDLKGDKILQDIISPPSPGEELGPDEVELKLKVLRVLRSGGPAVYTSKPFQIAIGKLN